jgi:hypothetical protein
LSSPPTHSVSKARVTINRPSQPSRRVSPVAAVTPRFVHKSVHNTMRQVHQPHASQDRDARAGFVRIDAVSHSPSPARRPHAGALLAGRSPVGTRVPPRRGTRPQRGRACAHAFGGDQRPIRTSDHCRKHSRDTRRCDRGIAILRPTGCANACNLPEQRHYVHHRVY